MALDARCVSVLLSSHFGSFSSFLVILTDAFLRSPLSPLSCTTRHFSHTVGSIHTTFSDLPILVPIIARRSGARVDPLKGTAEIVKACTEFLAEKEGEVLSLEVVPGDENGARPGEGGPKEGGKKDEKVPMEGEVGSWRMHVKGKW